MVNYEELNNMCEWEKEKALFLVKVAQNLGWNNDDSIIGLNQNSGYTYIYNENYSYTLFMPISCDLKKSDVYALWTNSENGDEIECELSDDDTLNSLFEWVKECENE